MGLIKRRLILFHILLKVHYKEKIFKPYLDLRRSAASDPGATYITIGKLYSFIGKIFEGCADSFNFFYIGFDSMNFSGIFDSKNSASAKNFDR
jgi:hypothetical protein